MDASLLYMITAVLFVAALGGVAFAFVGGSSAAAQKRLAQVGQSAAPNAQGGRTPDTNNLRRKNVQELLKDLEKQQAAKKQRPTVRRRIEQAGLGWSMRTFWLISAALAIGAAALSSITGQSLIVTLLAAFAAGFGLPRWLLAFLKSRREKKFTNEFANAIDVIVRSVKSGLPTTEALKIVAKEMPEPVAGEFNTLVEGLKVGVSLEQGLRRMYDNMPTAEVNFFAIVMTIQQKSGGNLSEALNNLAGVLRDRKRLKGKIKAMSSEAKASAMIIGSLPPAVMALIYITTPDYIGLLFSERLGNLMLGGCVLWMAAGVFVMHKMISFKH